MTDNTEFKNGEVVQLISGGPPLTVIVRPDAGIASFPVTHCIWFDEAGHFHEKGIPTVALKEYVATQGSVPGHWFTA